MSTARACIEDIIRNLDRDEDMNVVAAVLQELLDVAIELKQRVEGASVHRDNTELMQRARVLLGK